MHMMSMRCESMSLILSFLSSLRRKPVA